MLGVFLHGKLTIFLPVHKKAKRFSGFAGLAAGSAVGHGKADNGSDVFLHGSAAARSRERSQFQKGSVWGLSCAHAPARGGPPPVARRGGGRRPRGDTLAYGFCFVFYFCCWRRLARGEALVSLNAVAGHRGIQRRGSGGGTARGGVCSVFSLYWARHISIGGGSNS